MTMPKIHELTITLPIITFRIPFTRYCIALERVVLHRGKPDEAKKELIVMGLFR